MSQRQNIRMINCAYRAGSHWKIGGEERKRCFWQVGVCLLPHLGLVIQGGSSCRQISPGKRDECYLKFPCIRRPVDNPRETTQSWNHTRKLSSHKELLVICGLLSDMYVGGGLKKGLMLSILQLGGSHLFS